MSKIKLKGIIIQSSWSDEPHICARHSYDNAEPAERFKSDPHQVFHREFEIEIDKDSLRFDPADDKQLRSILATQKIRYLEKQKSEKLAEAELLDQKIKELLAIEDKS